MFQLGEEHNGKQLENDLGRGQDAVELFSVFLAVSIFYLDMKA